MFLIDELLQIMQTYKADYTNTFVALTLRNIDSTNLSTVREFTEWYEKWQARLRRQSQSQQLVQQFMQKSNPFIIPRNHRVEEAIEAAVDRTDYSVMQRLLEVLAQPFAYSSSQELYRILPENIKYTISYFLWYVIVKDKKGCQKVVNFWTAVVLLIKIC